MKTNSIDPKLRVTLAAALALLGGTAFSQEPAGPVEPRAGDASTKESSPPPDDSWVDAHVALLTANAPRLTAVRLDRSGAPCLRVDLYHGPTYDAAARRVQELLGEFSVETNDGAALGEWTFALDAPAAPREVPLFTFFDADEDVALVYRAIDDPTTLAASCSSYTYLVHDKSGANHATYYYYFASDIASAVAGPNKQTSSDPDLYLYYKSGSVYKLLDSSTYSSRLDDVGGFNTGCNGQQWRVKVYMYAAGKFSLAAHSSSSS